jgi:hypothetical protein
MEQGHAALLVANFSNNTEHSWRYINRIYYPIARVCQENSIFTCACIL